MSTPVTEVGTAEGGPPKSLLETIRLLRLASPALLDQLAMYAQLARIEWMEEKRRLLQLWLAGLAGFACLLCVLILTGALVVTLTWDGPWRLPSVLFLLGFYLAGLAFAWHRLTALSARSGQAFAAVREELTADIELLRSRL